MIATLTWHGMFWRAVIILFVPGDWGGCLDESDQGLRLIVMYFNTLNQTDSAMKLCVAQTRPTKGDIQANLEKHVSLIDLAVAHGVDVIIFPELSLTGYEPALAADLATHRDDARSAVFQRQSDTSQIVIGVGVPIKKESGICISLVFFQPHQPGQLYSKQYLHPDENPYFVSGEGFSTLSVNDQKIALAICYELSVPEHAENACTNGATVYIASVAKSVSGIDKALNQLADIARAYAIPVLMANCVGQADGEECAGKTSIWNEKGQVIGQLDDVSEGLLMIDLNSQKVAERPISNP